MMLSKLINVDMTYREAFIAFSIAVKGKTREERAEIYEKEFRPIMREILEKELELGQQDWMMGD